MLENQRLSGLSYESGKNDVTINENLFEALDENEML